MKLGEKRSHFERVYFKFANPVYTEATADGRFGNYQTYTWIFRWKQMLQKDSAFNSGKYSLLKNLVGTQIPLWNDSSVLMES